MRSERGGEYWKIIIEQGGMCGCRGNHAVDRQSIGNWLALDDSWEQDIFSLAEYLRACGKVSVSSLLSEIGHSWCI